MSKGVSERKRPKKKNTRPCSVVGHDLLVHAPELRDRIKAALVVHALEDVLLSRNDLCRKRVASTLPFFFGLYQELTLTLHDLMSVVNAQTGQKECQLPERFCPWGIRQTMHIARPPHRNVSVCLNSLECWLQARGYLHFLACRRSGLTEDRLESSPAIVPEEQDVTHLFPNPLLVERHIPRNSPKILSWSCYGWPDNKLALISHQRDPP
jgi:hypothetical protein